MGKEAVFCHKNYGKYYGVCIMLLEMSMKNLREKKCVQKWPQESSIFLYIPICHIELFSYSFDFNVPDRDQSLSFSYSLLCMKLYVLP